MKAALAGSYLRLIAAVLLLGVSFQSVGAPNAIANPTANQITPIGIASLATQNIDSPMVDLEPFLKVFFVRMSIYHCCTKRRHSREGLTRV